MTSVTEEIQKFTFVLFSETQVNLFGILRQPKHTMVAMETIQHNFKNLFFCFFYTNLTSLTEDGQIGMAAMAHRKAHFCQPRHLL